MTDVDVSSVVAHISRILDTAEQCAPESPQLGAHLLLLAAATLCKDGDIFAECAERAYLLVSHDRGRFKRKNKMQ